MPRLCKILLVDRKLAASYNQHVAFHNRLTPMPLKNSTDQTSLREMNLSAVLGFICNEAAVSRSPLTGKTGFDRSTISSLIVHTLERRLIEETGIHLAGMSRSAILLEINGRVEARVKIFPARGDRE